LPAACTHPLLLPEEEEEEIGATDEVDFTEVLGKRLPMKLKNITVRRIL
jgi:hypothetical protein